MSSKSEEEKRSLHEKDSSTSRVTIRRKWINIPIPQTKRGLRRCPCRKSEKDVEYPSKAGYKVKSDISSKEADPSEFDGVYIPGGYSPDGMRQHEATIEFVKKVHENGKPIAAVCHGPWVVADAGLLDGIKATSTPTIKNDLINSGAKWEDREVVVDNKAITSRSPKDLPAHVKAFVEALK